METATRIWAGRLPANATNILILCVDEPERAGLTNFIRRQIAEYTAVHLSNGLVSARPVNVMFHDKLEAEPAYATTLNWVCWYQSQEQVDAALTFVRSNHFLPFDEASIVSERSSLIWAHRPETTRSLEMQNISNHFKPASVEKDAYSVIWLNKSPPQWLLKPEWLEQDFIKLEEMDDEEASPSPLFKFYENRILSREPPARPSHPPPPPPPPDIPPHSPPPSYR